VTSCIVDSAAIYIMVVKFKNTIWPPPPQLLLHRRAALSSNSNGTWSVNSRENSKSSLYCEMSVTGPNLWLTTHWAKPRAYNTLGQTYGLQHTGPNLGLTTHWAKPMAYNTLGQTYGLQHTGPNLCITPHWGKPMAYNTLGVFCKRQDERLQ
jgi:hypothetical protein